MTERSPFEGKPHPLSFEELAKGVARILAERGEGEAERICELYQRNIAWDRHKLLKRAQEIAASSRSTGEA